MDLVMPPMPFSAVFAPTAGTLQPRIPEDMRNTSSDKALGLPPGVVQVIVTWTGSDQISIRHHRGSKWEVVTRIPAGPLGEMRSSGVLTLVSDEAHTLELIRTTSGDWDQSTMDKGYVVGVQVMPMGTPADVTGGGSILRVDNSVGTRVFLGDQMIHGDTGWRRLTDADGFFPHGVTVSGLSKIARQGDIVTLVLSVKIPDQWTAANEVFTPPVGFRPRAGTYFGPAYASNVSTYFGTNGFQYYGATNLTLRWLYTYRVRSGEPWPASLPGTSF